MNVNVLVGRVLTASLLLVVLVACGKTVTPTVSTEKPGEFSIVTLTAFCIDAAGAGVRIEWSAAERAEQYVLLRGGTELVTLGAAVRSYSDTESLAPGAAPAYTVQALNEGGQTDTAEVSLAVAADLCDTELPEPPVAPTPPAPVTGFSASFECTPQPGIRLTWPAVNGATGYVVQRDHVTVAEPAAGTLEHFDATVSPGATYTFVLQALNDVGLTLSAPLTVAVPFADCGVKGPVVAAGRRHSLAIAADGRVWAWGSNDSAQLGAGHYTVRLAPVPVVGMERAVAVAAGNDHSLALDSDGQLWAWGGNNYGELGTDLWESTVASPVELPGRVIAMAAGAEHSLAVTADGHVWAWGRNNHGQTGADPVSFPEGYRPHQIAGLTDVVDVFAGRYSSFALHMDGTVSAWGYNDFGALGVGHDNDIHVPEPVSGLNQVVQVSGGRDHSLARTADGSVYVWGRAAALGLGAGASHALAPQLQPGLSGIVSVAGFDSRSLAVDADGTVWTWGDISNEVGEFAATVTSSVPVEFTEVTTAVAVFDGEEHSIALLQDGSLVAWGSNERRQLGSSLPLGYSEFVQTEVTGNVLMASGGEENALALLDDGTVLGWGWSMTGVAGSVEDQPFPTPTLLGLTDAQYISVGSDFSLVLDGAGDVWSWGYGLNGRLGHGNADSQTEPVSIAALSGITQISAGDRHSLAIDSLGQVWAWGYGLYGQVGNGGTADASTPVQLSALSGTAISVAAGRQHSLAVLDDGTVWAWGANSFGQLGQGATGPQQSSPVQVSLITERAVAVAAANFTSYALLEDGTVLAWGQNSYGQLGTGSYTNSSSPTLVGGLSGVAQLSAGAGSVLAVTTSGDLYGWGSNYEGQLGFEAPRLQTTPVRLDTPGTVGHAAAGGSDYSLIVVDGKLYASGNDGYLLTGMGRVVFSTEPLVVMPGVELAGR